MKKMLILLLPALTLLLASLPLRSGAAFPPEAASLAENAVGRRTGDFTLIDQDGRPFKLSSLKGKPLVLNFVYTDCGHVCPAILKNLDAAIKKVRSTGTDNFHSLTVGFDSENDSPGRMKTLSENLKADIRGWTFASADKKTIEALAKDTGFLFIKTASGYDHLNLVTIIGPDGGVFKQVYGADFDANDLRASIDAAIRNKPVQPFAAGLLDRIKLFCSTYDETTGTYKIDYTFLMAVVMGLAIHSTVAVLLVYFFKRKRPAMARQKTILTFRK